MKKFTWTKVYKLNRYYTIYLSDRIQYGFPPNKTFCWAQYTTGINGPNTAYTELFLSVEWPTQPIQHWATKLSKQFKGKNAGISARAWCNYLLNNPPDYIETNMEGIEYESHVNFYKFYKKEEECQND